MAVEVTAYKPYCCNRAMLSKKSARRHEKLCLKNPNNRACPTCEFLSAEMETYYNPHHNGDPGSTDREYKIEYCSADPDNPVAHIEYKRDCPKWNGES